MHHYHHRLPQVLRSQAKEELAAPPLRRAEGRPQLGVLVVAVTQQAQQGGAVGRRQPAPLAPAAAVCRCPLLPPAAAIRLLDMHQLQLMPLWVLPALVALLLPPPLLAASCGQVRQTSASMSTVRPRRRNTPESLAKPLACMHDADVQPAAGALPWLAGRPTLVWRHCRRALMVKVGLSSRPQAPVVVPHRHGVCAPAPAAGTAQGVRAAGVLG